ncbi:prepilin-type N-terminal cleavage/methylation domain-containing protein [Eubacterium sp. 1001713B170207_170306_E7]|uniref:prepilin-type N-terminal cleavage/methylation domain-containing protein n=1 Tax=Eubacterium sp. 1001713B170207_170306_E7 TaxID=2787097 RepID=UPI00189AF64B|nr:prepilin-type N-terminal cleavage/methylation domain-containing protein [Eubacterium sp. 1001713B170207_170306_E7]
MIQMINKLKKNRKGFTLVELIVVLVILAILAAFTIPAMLGFVDDARGKAGIAEAREIYMAYSGSVTEVIAGGKTADAQGYDAVFVQSGVKTSPSGDTKAPSIQKGALNKLSGDVTDGDKVTNGSEWMVTVTDGKVTEVKYWVTSGYLITLNMEASGSEATVEKMKTAPGYTV